MKRWFNVFLMMVLIVGIIGVSPGAKAQASTSGSFSVLTYNVAGLPWGFSSSNPEVNTIKISPLLNIYDIVNVQEDFNFHNDLIQYANHPYKTPHSGIAGFGDGMNTLSYYPIEDFKRIRWNKSHGLIGDGSDQLTPKGFSYARHKLAPGVYLDVYNLHADAGSDSKSLEARRDNILQLSNYIKEHSAGNAVIVMGDTNTRYTRAEDNIRVLLDENGLIDPWIELVRGGDIPNFGDALLDDSNRNGPNYEVVDKVFYRGSRDLQLTATSYRLEDTRFVDENGNQLSDHYPIHVEFSYTLNPAIKLSDSFGGSGGTAFNFLAEMPENAEVSTISVRGAARVDQVGMTYSNGHSIYKGGNGGSAYSLQLGANEYITSVEVHKGTRNGSERIFYIEFRTNLNRTLSVGTQTSNKMEFHAPSGWQITGLFGRSGNEVDKLGVIYMPR